MFKNIFIHLVFSIAVSFLAAKFLHENTYCESMCGFYYLYSAAFLLPIFFLLGLPVPIGLKKYPKNNQDHSSKFKRKMCLILGCVGMLSIVMFFVVSIYIDVHNKYNKTITSSTVAAFSTN